ncbi:MAG TPA: hypothetical protein VM029_13760 [Opitutaceae bacterium]|nr:hypothetical protein [Opitutaceae bacterium]
MKLPVYLLGGVLAGTALRLLWPALELPTDGSSPPSADDKVTRASGGKTRPHGSPAPEESRFPPDVAKRADGILRGIGLSPKGPGDPESSWLYVAPRENVLLKSDEYVEASIVMKEDWVDGQCAPLFVQLGLRPDQEDKLRRLLAEMNFAHHEIKVLSAADPRHPEAGQIQQMHRASDESHRGRIEALLGPEKFVRFEAYFDSLPERRELDAAFKRVSAFADPLTPAQRDALVAARQATKKGVSSHLDLATVLNPAQLAVFAEWQADETAEAKLNGLLRHPTKPSPVEPAYRRREAVAPSQ